MTYLPPVDDYVATVDLTMLRGDTFEFEQTFTDAAGQPIDDPGATYRLTVKYRETDLDVDALFTDTFEQTSPGTSTLTMPASVTAALAARTYSLCYDVQVTETGGRVTTVTIGQLIVYPDISQVTP